MTIAHLCGKIGRYFNRCRDVGAYRLNEKRRDYV